MHDDVGSKTGACHPHRVGVEQVECDGAKTADGVQAMIVAGCGEYLMLVRDQMRDETASKCACATVDENFHCTFWHIRRNAARHCDMPTARVPVSAARKRCGC